MARDFSRQLLDAMEQYTDEVVEAVEEVVDDVGKHGREEWKQAAPKRTGAYRRSIKLKKMKSNGVFRVTIYSDAPYHRLTHLLEFGHKARDGSMVKAQPHIAQVEQDVTQELEDILTEVLKG